MIPDFGTPEKDTLCDNFAQYLKEELNKADTSKIIVKTAFADNIVPHPSLCPLLKVYRQFDRYQNGTIKCESSGSIEYILAYPNVREIPGITNWISKWLNYLLIRYNLEHRGCVRPLEQNFTVTRGMMLGETTQPVYAFVRGNILILDN